MERNSGSINSSVTSASSKDEGLKMTAVPSIAAAGVGEIVCVAPPWRHLRAIQALLISRGDSSADTIYLTFDRRPAASSLQVHSTSTRRSSTRSTIVASDLDRSSLQLLQDPLRREFDIRLREICYTVL